MMINIDLTPRSNALPWGEVAIVSVIIAILCVVAVDAFRRTTAANAACEAAGGTYLIREAVCVKLQRLTP